MIYYVIKRNDEDYYNSQQTWGLRFSDDIIESSFYMEKIEAENTLEWIINNKYRYGISREQLKVVKVEIKELLENE